jgi:hypothetical protein
MAAKKTNYTPYLIGAGALGILAYLFKDDIKALFKKSNVPNDEDPIVIGIPPTVPEKIITPNDGTNARLTSMFKTGSTNLFKAYNALFAIYAASQGKALKKWFDVYQTYLSSPQLRQAGRNQYFKNNPII